MSVTLASADDPMFGLLRVLTDDGDVSSDPGVDDATLRRMYRELRRLRTLDEKMLIVQRQGRIGFYGEVKGQEATPVATGFALRADDWVFPGLREGAVMLVRGFPLATYVAQCWGNGLDVQKGRQMPSHFSGRAVNQVSWSSCIGPQIPQAVGAAWAMRRKARAISDVSSKLRRILSVQRTSAGSESRTCSRIAIAPSGSASQCPPRALEEIFFTGQARLMSTAENAGPERRCDEATMGEASVADATSSRSAARSNRPSCSPPGRRRCGPGARAGDVGALDRSA